MKPMRFVFILILGLFILKPYAAVGQTELPTGLYKLEDKSAYTLSLDGKIYHTNGAPIALLKNISNINHISVAPDRFRKDDYNLNIELDAEAVKNMKNTPRLYGTTEYIGLIIAGKLVLAMVWAAPTSAANIVIGSRSKAQLEEIANKLKAEAAKKM